MQFSWLKSIKAVLLALAYAAQYTATTVDDQLIAALQVVVDYPAVQQLIESLIAASHASPQLEASTLLQHASPALLAEAQATTVGKIGDGRLLELLEKILPLILKIV